MFRETGGTRERSIVTISLTVPRVGVIDDRTFWTGGKNIKTDPPTGSINILYYRSSSFKKKIV